MLSETGATEGRKEGRKEREGRQDEEKRRKGSIKKEIEIKGMSDNGGKEVREYMNEKRK